MGADQDRLAGFAQGRLWRQRRLQGGDLGVHVGDDGGEGGRDAVVQLADRLAAVGGDDVRRVVLFGVGTADDAWEERLEGGC